MTDDEAEEDWLNRELDMIMFREWRDAQEEASKMDAATWAAELARMGQPEMLRKMHPDIADLIHPPKLRRGQHRPRIGTLDQRARVQNAYDDAKRIRALWRERGSKGQHAATWYAARRWDIKESALLDFRPSGPKKTRAR